MRHLLLCALIAATLPLTAFSQEAAPAQQGSAAADLWLVRSQTITDALIKDAADFTLSGRALLWARLAQRWSRDDPEKSRSWMVKSIEIVEAIPNRETLQKEHCDSIRRACC